VVEVVPQADGFAGSVAGGMAKSKFSLFSFGLKLEMLIQQT